MFGEPYSAKSFERYMAMQAEKEMQPKMQTAELQKQTSALADMKELTKLNAEYVKQIAELTIENQKSATKQFIASIIVSAVALIIAGASLCVSIIQLHK